MSLSNEDINVYQAFLDSPEKLVSWLQANPEYDVNTHFEDTVENRKKIHDDEKCPLYRSLLIGFYDRYPDNTVLLQTLLSRRARPFMKDLDQALYAGQFKLFYFLVSIWSYSIGLKKAASFLSSLLISLLFSLKNLLCLLVYTLLDSYRHYSNKVQVFVRSQMNAMCPSALKSLSAAQLSPKDPSNQPHPSVVFSTNTESATSAPLDASASNARKRSSWFKYFGL